MQLIPPDREIELKEAFFSGANHGFFVEVGAGDPHQESQSFHLERLGWTGVLIEPLDEFVEKLRLHRSGQVFNVACSSPENAGKSMPLFVAGVLSSLERDKMAAGAKILSVRNVATKTLDQILIEAKVPSGIDFLSVDVEGHELSVLRGFDFQRWRPRLIFVEDHVANHEKIKFMNGVGYRLIRHTHYNGWYIPCEARADITWADRWRLLRKYVLGLPIRKFRDASRRRRRLRAAS